MHNPSKVQKATKVFYKIIKLDFLGEGQQNSYVKVKRLMHSDMKTVAGLPKLVKEENFDQLLKESDKLLDSVIIEGRIYGDGGEEIPFDKSNYKEYLPFDAMGTISKEVMGQSF